MEKQDSIGETLGKPHIVGNNDGRKPKLLLEPLDQPPRRRAISGSTIVVGSS